MSDATALILDVTLLADRWHGVGDWPPSPFRLFQALVAGAYGGRWAAEESRDERDEVFAWLERLEPPVIFAPPHERQPSAVNYFVPNNDLDAKNGDPRNVSSIRIGKTVQATQLGDERTIRYAWTIHDDERELAERLIEYSLRLHLFGRGVDAAYVDAKIVPEDEAFATAGARSRVVRPSASNAGGAGRYAQSLSDVLPCPTSGSLASLHERFRESQGRFVRTRVGRRDETAFRQPSKAVSRGVAYDRPATIVLFDVLALADDGFAPVRLTAAAPLTVAVRDALAARLASGFEGELDSDRLVIGRGSDEHRDRSRRLRVVPLPSIGSTQTNMAIRRVAIVLPHESPVGADDVRWALAAQRLEAYRARLALATSRRQLFSYGCDSDRAASAAWRSVTPMVVPARDAGRRGGRSANDAAATSGIIDAIRHAGIDARPISVAVQREPLFLRGAPAWAFDADRFGTSRLTHATIVFDRPVAGPLVLGDGRWLGLGVFAARRDHGEPAMTPVLDASTEDDAVDEEETADE